MSLFILPLTSDTQWTNSLILSVSLFILPLNLQPSIR
eukprot:COSAG03_NODE_175_length_11150_cov_7.837691_4_plen_37_part_00